MTATELLKLLQDNNMYSDYDYKKKLYDDFTHKQKWWSYSDDNDYFKKDFETEWMTKPAAKPARKETDEEKVVRILKGDFEKKFGMTFEKFIEVREKLLETHPEKLI